MESLGELYLITNQPRQVVQFYLRLDKAETFELVRRFRLFDIVEENAVRFLQLKSRQDDVAQGDPNPEALALLIDHSHTIPPATVLKQLSKLPYFQYCYICALREREGGFLEDWGDLQVFTLERWADDRSSCMLRIIGRNCYTFSRHRIHIIWKRYAIHGVCLPRRARSVKKRVTLRNSCIFSREWAIIDVH
jgi:hypothetical protein